MDVWNKQTNKQTNFVDIGGIDDYHCLHFLFTTVPPKKMKKKKQKQKQKKK